ncbi:MAG TPA: transglutaminase domain-containing protein, partial [Candidatus Binatia bacterium]|nr:transglutaminase domain-containing protein [Candidatus Binatia bacterium]
RSGTPLPVFFHGKNLTEALRLPGPLTYAFHNGAVEGAVGLGEKPVVRLYARGLPVWEGAVLDQMSHLQTHDPAQSEIGQGLFPVFLLNGNRLDVTFSRRLALENKALENVRKTAEKALQRLLGNALERAFPRPWVQRGGDHLRAMASRLRRPGWLWLVVLLLVVLPLEIVLLERFFPPRGRPTAGFFDLSTASIQYSGASVGSAVSALSARFSYTPADPRWFKVFSAADYDLQAGFVRRRGEFFSAAVRGGTCAQEQTVTMRFNAAVAGRVMLPLPPGYAIEPDSVAFGTESRPLPLSENSLGEWSVEIPFVPGTVVYRSCPESRDVKLTPPEAKRLTRLPPGLALPAVLEKSLSAARALTTAEKAAHAQTLVRAAVRFDASESTARAYRRSGRGRQWLPKVLAIGKGDCDVINGVHVLLLRRLGIPARLAVGLIGSEGRIRSGLHAWSEYFDGGWRIVDASASDSGPTSPVQAASERSARSGPDRPAVSAPLPKPGTRLAAIFISRALALPLILLVLLWRKNGRRRKLAAPQGR